MTPAGTRSFGQFYVLGYDNGLIKVGKSEDASLRIRGLRTETGRAGLVTSSWLSVETTRWHLNELRLLVFCHENFGEPAKGQETFWGDYDTTLTYALTLPCA